VFISEKNNNQGIKMENIIFYFSGTGNCLAAAKTIAKEPGNTEIVSMGRPGKYTLSKQYDSIGFIYPVYFWGLPKRVIDFTEKLEFGSNRNTYCYSIASNGGDPGNTLNQLGEILYKNHRVKLNYGAELKMFSNYVVMYDMRKNVEEITLASNEKLIPVIKAIKNKTGNSITKWKKPLVIVNKLFLKAAPGMDKNYNVSDACTACGVCEAVCPVKNIEISDNKPRFKHNCEQCVACIQYCPAKAINYKNATQKRGRYTHPDIGYRDLAEYNEW